MPIARGFLNQDTNLFADAHPQVNPLVFPPPLLPLAHVLLSNQFVLHATRIQCIREIKTEKRQKQGYRDTRVLIHSSKPLCKNLPCFQVRAVNRYPMIEHELHFHGQVS